MPAFAASNHSLGTRIANAFKQITRDRERSSRVTRRKSMQPCAWLQNDQAQRRAVKNLIRADWTHCALLPGAWIRAAVSFEFMPVIRQSLWDRRQGASRRRHRSIVHAVSPLVEVRIAISALLPPILIMPMRRKRSASVGPSARPFWSRNCNRIPSRRWHDSLLLSPSKETRRKICCVLCGRTTRSPRTLKRTSRKSGGPQIQFGRSHTRRVRGISIGMSGVRTNSSVFVGYTLSYPSNQSSIRANPEPLLTSAGARTASPEIVKKGARARIQRRRVLQQDGESERRSRCWLPLRGGTKVEVRPRMGSWEEHFLSCAAIQSRLIAAFARNGFAASAGPCLGPQPVVGTSMLKRKNFPGERTIAWRSII